MSKKTKQTTKKFLTFDKSWSRWFTPGEKYPVHKESRGWLYTYNNNGDEHSVSGTKEGQKILED